MLVRAEPPIRKPRYNLVRYALVILGAPISRLWLAPPVRSYVRDYRDMYKKVAFVGAQSTPINARSFAELLRPCGQRPLATLAVDEKPLPPAAYRASVKV